MRQTIAVICCLFATQCGPTSSSRDSAAQSDATSQSDVASQSDASSQSDAASQSDASSSEATTAAVTAAEAFLATLSSEQRTAVQFAYDDDAQKVRWSNFPTGIFSRAGLKFGVLSEAQQTAVWAMLRAVLSAKGYQQVVDTVDADEVLRSQTTGGNLVFGKAEYFVALRGAPSMTSPWCIQFGGHHLAINVTIRGARMTLAPSLTGAQPTSFTRAGSAVRVQGEELDAAFAMVNSLTPEQRATAVIGAAVMDLALGPGQDGRTVANEGIRADALTAAQREQLVALIQTRVGMINDSAASLKMSEVRATLDQTYFAWSGPTAVGSAAYFRVTGPSLFIEYSPQSMGGSATNHTHAMYREFGNDYGASL